MLLSSIAFIAVFIAVFIILGLYAWRREHTKYNSGNCRKCNKPWQHFDTDSQGGELFTCKSCNGFIAVTWPGIIRKDRH